MLRLKPELKGALLALLGVALVLVGVWTYTGIRLGIWTYNEYSRYVWLTANLPVAYHLWHGDIKGGDDVEKLADEWRPDRISRFGRWVEFEWYPYRMDKDSISFIGVTVRAKDGVLVQAASWSDDGLGVRLFFDTLTPDAKAEYASAFKAYGDSLRAKWESETNRTPSMAGSNLK